MPKKHKVPKTKVCPTCGKRKALSEFSSKPGGKYDRDTYCKLCKSGKYRQWWINSDKGIRERLNREILNWVLKLEGCIISGDTQDLVFHHVDPSTKDFDILRRPRQEWDRILNEVMKCVPMTRSLHSKLHKVLNGEFVATASSKFIKYVNDTYGIAVRTLKKTTEFMPHCVFSDFTGVSNMIYPVIQYFRLNGNKTYKVACA